MATDRLLSEVERQEKYLARLPQDFKFPLFNAKQALESQRASAYRSTAAAGREIVDNALEAGADDVRVVFETARNATREYVNSVAFIDNGAGMLADMARYALTWGGGTHFDDPAFIGKFGFGLPNSSINQTRRVDLYTRTSAEEPFTHAWLDLETFDEFGLQEIPPPESVAGLPAFVEKYFDHEKMSFAQGTIVVWSNPDRLSYRTPARLREHLLDDFGVTYRYLLRSSENPQGAVIQVAGKQVDPIDPLFLYPGGRYFVPESDGGAVRIEDRTIPVKYALDPESGERHLSLVRDESELDPQDPNLITAGAFRVTVSRFPVGFAADKGRRGETTDAHRRFEIRKTRRGISFVRAGREIQTIEAFPRSARDVASGMGRWPLLQAYAYHWGVEISFSPTLDEIFGITNDKQGVRPVEDLWRVLHQAEIDASLRRENSWQSAQRTKKPQLKAVTGPSPAEQAARDADEATGTVARVPEFFRQSAKEELEAAANQRAGATEGSIADAKKALAEEAERRPYRIEYFDSPHGPFYEPMWVGSQLVVQINKSHPFFQTLYGRLMKLPRATGAKEAVDLLLITLAKAELTAQGDEMPLWYAAQRKHQWSPFLEIALKSLEDRLRRGEEEDEDAGIVDAA